MNKLFSRLLVSSQEAAAISGYEVVYEAVYEVVAGVPVSADKQLSGLGGEQNVCNVCNGRESVVGMPHVT